MLSAILIAAAFSMSPQPECPNHEVETFEGKTSVCLEWEVSLMCGENPVVICYDWGAPVVFDAFTLEARVVDGAIRVVAVGEY